MIDWAMVERAARARHERYCPWCPDSECLGLGWSNDVQYVIPILEAALCE